MDAIKYEHRIVYLSVWSVILLLSAVARMQALAGGCDSSTAWIVFVSVSALLIGLHQMIECGVHSAISLLFPKSPPQAQIDAAITEGEEQLPVKQATDNLETAETAEGSERPQKETVAEQPFLANLPAKEEEDYDYEGARANYFEAQRQMQTEKLDRVLLYTRGTFAPHLKPEAIEALCESVEAFVIRGEIVSPSIALFLASVIKTNDIKHYDWNIA